MANNNDPIVYLGGSAYTPTTILIDTATSGDNTLVAGVTGKQVVVMDFAIEPTGTAVNVYFHDTTGSPVMVRWSATRPLVLDKAGTTGPRFVRASGVPGLPKMVPTSTGKGLVLNLSTTQGVSGLLTYILV